jgi:general secretion pathway protein B
VSFILDALRKSEHERQRSTLPGLSQVPLATPEAQLPRWALVVIGVLAAAVLVLGGAWWQSTRAPVRLTAEFPTVERPLPLPPPTATTTSTAATPRVAPQASAPPERIAAARDSALATAAAPTDSEPAPAAPSFTPPPAAQSAGEIELPSVAALAADGIVLPAMHLELLRFREQPSERFVFVNGRKYVEGERLVEGPELVSIVPAGAVLLHAGRRFLLVAE